MKAIAYDRLKQRHELEIEKATEIISNIATDTDKSYKVTYSLSFYDNRRRPVYTEKSREEITTTMEEGN